MMPRAGWFTCMTSIVLMALVPYSVQAKPTPSISPRSVKIAQAAPIPSITADRVKAALPKLDVLVEQVRQKTNVPGIAIAIVYKDEVVYLKGFGVREAGKKEPVDGNTVFQLASLSKPIASTVVAAVVGQGRVKWDDPMIKHYPTFALDSPYVTREVTLRDLLSHRSGLPDHAGDDLEDLGFDRATILQRLRYLSTDNRFRSVYNYTNFGLTAAAEAVAKAAGKSWEDLSEEKLYRPLGMQDTSSRFADFIANKDRARGHSLIGGKWVAKYQRQPDPESPAGGVSSSVRDLAQWVRLQLGNGKYDGRPVIPAEALAETHRPQMISHAPEDASTDRAGLYGLGWNVGYTNQGLVQLSHSGAFNLGAATAVYLLPAESLGIVVLTNASPIGVPEALSLSFFDLVQSGTVKNDYLTPLGRLFQKMGKPTYGTLVDYAKPPAQRSPALPSEAYVGAYRNDYFGEIAIVLQQGKLFLQLGPNKTLFPLQHYNRDVFSYQPVGENAFGLSAVTFTIGADQKASHVVIENLNLEKQGRFSRIVAR